uniref:Uncharacterized protein n=1 Tax=Anguilla anguilla TaxID=7936 RepID=A0A0E9SN78_ANGAN
MPDEITFHFHFVFHHGHFSVSVISLDTVPCSVHHKTTVI